MIQISRLSKSYGAQTLFREVDLVVGPGERIGLVGRNGHGKSTLFRFLIGMEEPDSGSISIPKNYRIGHLSQNISFQNETIRQEVYSALPLLEGGYREEHRADAVLSGLGFAEQSLEDDPRLLSGGYQVRLNLAKLLVSDVNLLLLDEPTNYLDIVSLRWLADFLRNWKEEAIIITHNRTFMDAVTTHTVGIHREKLRKVSGGTEKLYTLLADEEEQYERTRMNQLKSRAGVESFIRRFRAKASKARQVQSKIKMLEKQGVMEELSEIADLEFRFYYKPFNGKHALELKGCSFGYGNGDALLFRDLDLVVKNTDRIGVIGKNGKGKSTLLRMIAGELAPVSGEMVVPGEIEFGYFGQTNVERLDQNKTVEEEVLSVEPDRNRTRARTLCGAMMFEGDLALKKVGVLSGGEKSRVLLGKVLASPSNLLLLDEPTNHLDIYSSDAFVEAVKSFPGAVILVTHDEEVLDSIVNKLVVFDRGRAMLFDGNYRDFLSKIGWEDEEEASYNLSGTNTGSNKKELRRQRAAELKQRAEILKPLEQKVEALETQIEDLEQVIADQNVELMEGTKSGFNDALARLSRDMKSNQEKRDQLYEALECSLTALEQKRKELGA